jgi:hypothetical protein
VDRRGGGRLLLGLLLQRLLGRARRCDRGGGAGRREPERALRRARQLPRRPALRHRPAPRPQQRAAHAFAERAALDVLAPLGGDAFGPNWNRIPLHGALDLPVTLAALAGLFFAAREASRPEARARLGLALAALLAALLACGPATPLWGLFAALPGMWRFAKPETFFHLSVGASCVLAGPALARLPIPPWVVLLAQLGLWFLFARGNAELYPAFSGWTG